MALTFRTTGAWGVGTGVDLSAAEIDDNFYELELAIQALQSAGGPTPDEVVDVTTVGSSFSFVLESGTVIGPLPIPIVIQRDRGDWAPFTFYLELDTVRVAGIGIYLITADHTSGATFDPTLADSNGLIYQLTFSLDQPASFEGLAGVSISSPSAGDMIVYNGTDWVNHPPAEVLEILGVSDKLVGLKDVEIDSNLHDGQALVWNGGLNRWAPATPWQEGDSNDVAPGPPVALAGLNDVLIDSSLASDDGFALVWDNHLQRWKPGKPWFEGDSNLSPGSETLAGLVDVLIESGPEDGAVLTFDAILGKWTHRQDLDYLAQLIDVDIASGPADGEALFFSGPAGKWVARAPSSGIAFNPRGNWDSAAAYNPLDIALYDLNSATTASFLCYAPVPAGGSSTTKDSFDETFNANFVYTNTDFTAAVVQPNTWQVAKGHLDLTGKTYFEVSADALVNAGGGNTNSWGIGLVNENFVTQTTNFAGQDAGGNGVMYDAGNANVDSWYEASKNTQGGGTSPIAQNDRCAICFDKPNGRIWFRDITRDGGGTHWWGGSFSGGDDPTNPSTGLAIATLAAGSHVRIALSVDGSGGTSCQGTIFTAAADFIGTVPAGYSAPAVTTTTTNPPPISDPLHWIGGAG